MSVKLSKGSKLSLAKGPKAGPQNVILGLGWDAGEEVVEQRSGGFLGFGGRVERQTVKRSIDLDASCVVLDGSNQVVDTVWFRQLASRDGSIVHSGDNRTGDGDGDDEQIRVNLSSVPRSAQTLVFTINSFSGESFSQIKNASCRLLDGDSNAELARYDLSGGGSHTALIMAKLVREGDGWGVEAIGQQASGRTFHDLMPTILTALR